MVVDIEYEIYTPELVSKKEKRINGFLKAKNAERN